MGEPLTTTYTIAEPYERALKTLREAFEKEGLGISMELDVTGRIRGALGIGLLPCRVLYVDCPLVLLEALALNPSAATILPLHVVVSASGPRTMVHWMSSAGVRAAGLPLEVKDPIHKLQTKLSGAVSRVGTRQLFQLTA